MSKAGFSSSPARICKKGHEYCGTHVFWWTGWENSDKRWRRCGYVAPPLGSQAATPDVGPGPPRRLHVSFAPHRKMGACGQNGVSGHPFSMGACGASVKWGEPSSFFHGRMRPPLEVDTVVPRHPFYGCEPQDSLIDIVIGKGWV
jgi:hypothetical protein